jgi:hypothetical protein
MQLLGEEDGRYDLVTCVTCQGRAQIPLDREWTGEPTLKLLTPEQEKALHDEQMTALKAFAEKRRRIQENLANDEL